MSAVEVLGSELGPGIGVGVAEKDMGKEGLTMIADPDAINPEPPAAEK